MEQYDFVKDIGSGNFGVAKLMRDQRTHDLFAVKCIERGEKIDENVQREIINHRSLRHPNIIRFKEVFLTPTHLAIVMEYASGGELFERICNAGRFSENEARFFFQQLISGVSYCHSAEVCHRDLKLENTLLDGSPDPRLKICDFGYSKSAVLHSQPKSTVGTPAYIAPEVLSKKEYDGKRILSVQYSIPDFVHISSECAHLLSRIFVANPAKRITISEIKNHPWFLKNLPRDLLDGADSSCNNNHDEAPIQSVEQIMRIVAEARVPGHKASLSLSDPSLDSDDMDSEPEPDLDVESSSEFLCPI